MRYVNDSKATNTAAARRAVAAYDAPLHVILGGRGKGESYTELALDLAGRVRARLPDRRGGRRASRRARARGRRARAERRPRDARFARAAQNAQPGEVVLLSPACASYDQFRDFEERGDEFRRLVPRSPREEGPARVARPRPRHARPDAFGLVMVYSATSAPAALGGGDPIFYLKRQAIYAAIGVVLLLIVASRIDYRALRHLAPLARAREPRPLRRRARRRQQVNGARRWLSVGPPRSSRRSSRSSPRDLGAAYLARHRRRRR